MGEFITIDLSNLPAWDSRGGKITKFDVVSTSDGGEALLVCCPEWIAEQIEAATGKNRVGLKEETAKVYTHGYRFKHGVPDDVINLVSMLTNVLSIPAPENVDFAIALDWYKQPDDEGDIERTQYGYWIWTTKHASNPDFSNSRKSRREMIAALVEFISSHPMYAAATAIIAAPGHKADGQSFGEKLAREVAAKVGIPFVESSAPGPRPQQKEAPQDLTDEFTVDGFLSGTVIVLDDVFHTGGSASGAGAAAIRAGASEVLSLTVARTIRR